MEMAKAFGLFPTIYQEYSKKQVDSKYLFSIDIMVSYINNKCTYSTNLYTHISENFHSQDSFALLTTIIQFTFIQHNILSLFFHHLEEVWGCNITIHVFVPCCLNFLFQDCVFSLDITLQVVGTYTVIYYISVLLKIRN